MRLLLNLRKQIELNEEITDSWPSTVSVFTAFDAVTCPLVGRLCCETAPREEGYDIRARCIPPHARSQIDEIIINAFEELDADIQKQMARVIPILSQLTCTVTCSSSCKLYPSRKTSRTQRIAPDATPLCRTMAPQRRSSCSAKRKMARLCGTGQCPAVATAEILQAPGIKSERSPGGAGDISIKTAWVGDSRAVLAAYDGRGAPRVIELSNDHKVGIEMQKRAISALSSAPLLRADAAARAQSDGARFAQAESHKERQRIEKFYCGMEWGFDVGRELSLRARAPPPMT